MSNINMVRVTCAKCSVTDVCAREGPAHNHCCGECRSKFTDEERKQYYLNFWRSRYTHEPEEDLPNV